MKHLMTSLFSALALLVVTSGALAGTQGLIEVVVTEGGNTDKYFEIYTFDDRRFRIDFVGEDKKVTDVTPYVMTVDGGNTWVMGDKPKDRFYCSQMQTEAFFRNLGDQVTNAIEFFNVKTEAPTVNKVLEEPGPDMFGFKTTHVRLETNSKAYLWILFLKFEYSVKIVDDLWYTSDVEIHPIRQKWINALKQSGNSMIDNLFNDYATKLPGPVLKSETVVDITNVRKKKTKTQRQSTQVVSLDELTAEELDSIFVMPQCEMMDDDDEIRKKGKALLSGGKLML